MKNRLQYAYSIIVFIGVLFTSYLMMDKNSNARMPLRIFQGPSMRSEAVALDPAVNQLLEMEKTISRIRKEKEKELQQKRKLTEDGLESTP